MIFNFSIIQERPRDNEIFHLYLIKYGVIPHFDLLNNPAICCSPDGAIICDINFEKQNSDSSKENKLLKTHSQFARDISLNNILLNNSFYEELKFYADGIHHLIFLLCSPDQNENSYIKISGYISLFNSFGFLSADEFYTVDIYLFLSLFYFIICLYWVYKMISNNNGLNFYTKFISILLPVMLIEKMMVLQIYSELNKLGEFNHTFNVISIITNFIKNLIIRIFLFVLASGYRLNFSTFENISKKKVFNFSLLMIWYSLSLLVYLIIDSIYTYE